MSEKKSLNGEEARSVGAQIARAHLNEFPDYYTRLGKMQREAERGE
ncbi:MAG TPA: DUF5661 family protein [Solirubrobacteraceae bacterium]|nr:DUF5661 family protein [Solirubrobacteraceae bacterium]